MAGCKPHICGACGADSPRKACACRAVGYCNDQCQRRAWIQHRGVCTAALTRRLARHRERLGPDNPAIADELMFIGGLLYEQDRMALAQQHFSEALRIYLASSTHGEWSVQGADALSSLGNVHFTLGDLDAALKAHRRALRVYRCALGDDSARVGESLSDVGLVLYRQGLLDPSMSKLQQAYDTLCRLHGEDHGDVANIMGNMAVVLKDKGMEAEALAMEERALEIKRRALGGDDESTVGSLLNLGSSYRDLGMLEEARARYEEGFEILRRSRAAGTSALEARFLHNIGILYSIEGRLEDALRMYNRARRVFGKSIGLDCAEVARVMNNAGLVLKKQGKLGEAEGQFQGALAIERNVLGSEHASVATTLYNLALCREEAGDRAGAVSSLVEARFIYTKTGVTGDEAADVACALERLGG